MHSSQDVEEQKNDKPVCFAPFMNEANSHKTHVLGIQYLFPKKPKNLNKKFIIHIDPIF